MKNSNPKNYDFSRTGFSSIEGTREARATYTFTCRCFKCGGESTAQGHTLSERNRQAREVFQDWARIKVDGVNERAYCPTCADALLN
jgi:hypothetical protein